MGTRVNYEILQDGEDTPAVILFSNSSHDRVSPEEVFKLAAQDATGPTELVRELLNLTYSIGSEAGWHKAGDHMFTVDTSPGDRERVYRVRFLVGEDLISRGYLPKTAQRAAIRVADE